MTVKKSPGASTDYARIIGAARQKIFAGPERLLLNIVSECPLRCSFCYTHSCLINNRAARPQAMSLSRIRQIAAAADRWDARQITLVGRGEPTCHPRFQEIVAALSSKNRQISLLTNATFPARTACCVAKIARISVTLCAPDRKNYLKIHSPAVPGIYDLVIRNMAFLAGLRRKFGKPSTEIVFVLTRETIPLVPAMLAWVERTGIDKLRFQPFFPVKETQNLAPGQKDIKLLSEFCSAYATRAWSFEHNLRDIPGQLRSSAISRPARCYEGWFSLYIDSDSSVRYCCLNKHTSIGSLDKNSLEEIWRSKKAENVRAEWRTPPPQNPAKEDYCARCVYVRQNTLHGKRIDHILTRNLGLNVM
ncbi:MAG: radical SAM protein [Candidatus Omnitrophica bacterium]|nr:radical SAM protein [Candidatus Omnitrophota bacterium]